MKDENLQSLIDDTINKTIQELKILSYKSGDEITTFFLSKVLNQKNKETILLNFRRGIEMLIKKPLIVTVQSLTSEKIIAVRNDNLLQLLDDRYYSKLRLSSFIDLFKIETNNFKKLNISGEPHIKLIINYIQIHYNTTFRKFMNRNLEYFYIYKFFVDYGEDIKYILNILNAYHYSNNIENNKLYNVEIKEIVEKTTYIYERICELLILIHQKISK